MFSPGETFILGICLTTVAIVLFHAFFPHHLFLKTSAKQRPDSPKPVTRLDRNYFRDHIRGRLQDQVAEIDLASVVSDSAEGVRSSLMDFMRRLSQSRQSFLPRELSVKMIPTDLDVVSFVPGEKLIIRAQLPLAYRIAIGLFSMLFYTVFMGLMGLLFGSGLLGVIFGALMCIWRNLEGVYLKLDFTKNRHALVSPVSIDIQDGYPELEVRTYQMNGRWQASLSIKEKPFIERLSENEPDCSDLEAFAEVLEWQFRQSVELADGVVISA